MRTFFHCHPNNEDPEVLLDPEHQFSEPWGAREHGPCDKCGGSGTTEHECFSCLEAGTDPDCPACQGRVRFAARCPACEGSGEITNTRRRGVAVFPRRAGLYRYLADRGANVEGKTVVELEGRLSEEVDLDADNGALLAYPERVVAVEPLDAGVVEEIRRRDGGAPGG